MSRPRGNKWQADVVYGVDDNGKPKRHRITFNTKAEADAVEANPELHFRPKLTVGELFRKGYTKLWKNSKDRKMCLSHTEELIEKIGPYRQAKEITTLKVSDLVEQWTEEGQENSTINKKLSRLSMLMKYVKSHHEQDLVLPDTKRLKVYKKKRRMLNNEQEEQLLREGFEKERHKKLFDFLLYTGCRVSEALNLTWDGVYEDRIIFSERKGNSWDGMVPLVTKSKASLDRRASNIGPFADINYDNFYRHFIKAKEAAELGSDDGLVIHSLRHTCASRLVQRGVPIMVVKEWMDHTKIETTMIYAKLHSSQLFEAAKVLENPSVTACATSVRGSEGVTEPKVLEKLGFSL